MASGLLTMRPLSLYFAAVSREEKLACFQVSERCRHPANDVSAIHSH